MFNYVTYKQEYNKTLKSYLTKEALFRKLCFDLFNYKMSDSILNLCYKQINQRLTDLKLGEVIIISTTNLNSFVKQNNLKLTRSDLLLMTTSLASSDIDYFWSRLTANDLDLRMHFLSRIYNHFDNISNINVNVGLNPKCDLSIIISKAK